MSNRTKVSVIFGIAAIVIFTTLTIFFSGNADSPKTTFDWCALAFILISEAALFESIYVISTSVHNISKTLISLGIISTLFIYWVATVGIATFGRSIFKESLGGFITAQIIMCAIAAIITILLSMVAVRVAAKDAKLDNSKLLMESCESEAFTLKSNTAFREHYQSLNKLYEEIRFSDKTVSIDKEEIIYSQIRNLSDMLHNKMTTVNTQDISNTIEAIILNIKERNSNVLKLKQGGF